MDCLFTDVPVHHMCRPEWMREFGDSIPGVSEANLCNFAPEVEESGQGFPNSENNSYHVQQSLH